MPSTKTISKKSSKAPVPAAAAAAAQDVPSLAEQATEAYIRQAIEADPSRVLTMLCEKPGTAKLVSARAAAMQRKDLSTNPNPSIHGDDVIAYYSSPDSEIDATMGRFYFSALPELAQGLLQNYYEREGRKLAYTGGGNASTTMRAFNGSLLFSPEDGDTDLSDWYSGNYNKEDLAELLGEDLDEPEEGEEEDDDDDGQLDELAGTAAERSMDALREFFEGDVDEALKAYAKDALKLPYTGDDDVPAANATYNMMLMPVYERVPIITIAHDSQNGF